jgi:hypothetical protein
MTGIDKARAELDTVPTAAPPELVERLVRIGLQVTVGVGLRGDPTPPASTKTARDEGGLTRADRGRKLRFVRGSTWAAWCDGRGAGERMGPAALRREAACPRAMP